jgi:hypothetical protein
MIAMDMPRTALSRLVRTGLTLAVVDCIFSSVLVVVFYGSTFARLWQGVASTLLGPSAFDGGARTTAIGLLMHCGVAFGWSAVFILGVMRSARVQRVLASRFGTLKVASVYGPSIWLVMSLIVIPLLLHRPPKISFRWWVQFFGHVPFVGVPIVASARGREPASTPL